MDGAKEFGTLGVNPFRVLTYNMAFDSIFYLINRVRMTTTCNWTTMKYETGEEVLLSTMRKMFNMSYMPSHGSDQTGFSVENFARSYRHFFHGTMLYEAGSLTFRTIAFDQLVQSKRKAINEGHPTDLLYAFAIGSVT
jgi:uncharacterized membrane protein